MLTAGQIFDKYANDYQQRYMDVSRYGKALGYFAQTIRSGAVELLDAGCGPGNVSFYLKQLLPGIKVTGIDLAPNMLALACNNLPEETFIQMDVLDVQQLNKLFDAIVCSFCLPYLNPPSLQKLITNFSRCLHADSTLLISTESRDVYAAEVVTSSKGDQTMMYFHEPAQIRQLLQSNGFHVKAEFLKGIDKNAAKDGITYDFTVVAQLKK